jgi:methylthioribose-1-phosphate isomerase
MNVGGKQYRSIWLEADGRSVSYIDQTELPFAFVVRRMTRVDEAAEAIRAMRVRGAPLIGATAAFGICLALAEDHTDASLKSAVELLLATRPTARNLRWALDQMLAEVKDLRPPQRPAAAFAKAKAICDQDVAVCRAIGEHGFRLLRETSATKRGPVNVLTHCNAGWLACVDLGTALAPVYRAHAAGLPVHVWVDETRPRNQGALTAWELKAHGVPHTVIVDNAGGLLMQQGKVDLCLVGTDRTTGQGDVCNKIGTYLKALAAKDNGVPFYVALPSSSIDWETDGRSIPIEERGADEVVCVSGRTGAGERVTISVMPEASTANYGFDVTPARLITALVTERGLCPASAKGLRALFPENAEPERRRRQRRTRG